MEAPILRPQKHAARSEFNEVILVWSRTRSVEMPDVLELEAGLPKINDAAKSPVAEPIISSLSIN